MGLAGPMRPARPVRAYGSRTVRMSPGWQLVGPLQLHRAGVCRAGHGGDGAEVDRAGLRRGRQHPQGSQDREQDVEQAHEQQCQAHGQLQQMVVGPHPPG